MWTKGNSVALYAFCQEYSRSRHEDTERENKVVVFNGILFYDIIGGYKGRNKTTRWYNPLQYRIESIARLVKISCSRTPNKQFKTVCFLKFLSVTIIILDMKTHLTFRIWKKKKKTNKYNNYFYTFMNDFKINIS